MANRYVNVSSRQIAGQIADSLAVSGRLLLQDAYRQLAAQLPAEIERLGKALDLNQIPAGRLERANRQIASAAHDQMLKNWRSRLPRRSSPYRPEDRLTGDLGAALANVDQNIAGTTDRRIAFINTTYMTQEARHWYRVNYGAMGPNLAEGQRPRTFNLAVDNTPIGRLRDDNPPAARSYLPRSFGWIGSEMVNVRGPGRELGAGSRAARFTDIGLQTVANLLGDVYRDTFLQYAQEQAGRTKLAAANITVTRRMGDPGLSRFGVT